MREAFVGFDSAWAGKTPGGVVHASFDVGRLRFCSDPAPAHFDEAVDLIRKLQDKHDYVLVALDQPTRVPNLDGMRPVERVAGSLIGKLRSGVQPANRGRPFFGPDAPIWRFLGQIRARENPPAARSGEPGLHLVEVFPALAIPAIAPEIFERKRAARYNPENQKFCKEDWCLVCKAVARHASNFGLPSLAKWISEASAIDRVRKCHQDQLDAIICLVIALHWRRADTDQVAVIGDGQLGYMVTPVTANTRAVLKQAANKKGVPLDGPWHCDDY